MRASRWAVLISGRGSNLSSLLDYQDEIPIGLVVSSSVTAGGLWRARRAGIKTSLTPMTAFTTKTGEQKQRIDWAKLTELLRSNGVTHVCLAGFMKIVPLKFVQDWEGRLINLHPSLLPEYPGLESIERAHKEQADIGVTVHFVNEEVDAGKVISQRRCLKKHEVSRYSLGLTEFLVHVTEQRLLREAVQALGKA
jgi:phosphoribosylglycinamide formyltransferase 1